MNWYGTTPTKKENRRRKRKKNCPGFVSAEWRVKLAISSLYPLPAWSLSHLTNNKNHNHHYNNHSAFLRQRFQIRSLEAEISWPFKNSSILLVQSSGRWRKFLAGTYISILEHSLSPKVYFSVFTDRQSKYCRRDIKKALLPTFITRTLTATLRTTLNFMLARPQNLIILLKNWFIFTLKKFLFSLLPSLSWSLGVILK